MYRLQQVVSSNVHCRLQPITMHHCWLNGTTLMQGNNRETVCVCVSEGAKGQWGINENSSNFLLNSSIILKSAVRKISY